MKKFFLFLILFAAPVFGQTRFVKPAQTLSEMLAMNPFDTHTNVWLNGRTAFAKGGGPFSWDPSSTLATNSGTVFASLFAGWTNSAGRWLREFNGVQNPMYYGALGDGITDDGASIDAAMVAMGPGGKLNFGTNTFLIGHQLTNQYDRTAFFGEGATLQFNSPATTVGFLSDGKTNVSISSLNFSGAAGKMILLKNSTNAVVEGCSVSGATVTPGEGIGGGIVIYPPSRNVRVKNNNLTGNGTGANNCADIAYYSSGSTNDRNRDVQIVGNEVQGNATFAGIYVLDWDGVICEGNHITGSGQGDGSASGYGILVYSTANVNRLSYGGSVKGNVVKGTAGSGIYLQGANNFSIIGNTLTNTALNQTNTSLPVGGIALNNVRGVNVSGNTTDVSGHSGISVANGTNVCLIGNSFFNSTDNGIEWQGGIFGLSIMGNTIGPCRYGIAPFVVSPAAASTMSVVGNSIFGATNNSINTALCGDSVFADNIINQSAADYAIAALSGDRNSIHDNRIVGTGSGISGGIGIEVRGNSTTVHGNRLYNLLNGVRNVTGLTNDVRDNFCSNVGTPFTILSGEAAIRTVTTGTTPSVQGMTGLVLTYASPTTITDFTDGVLGQTIWVKAGNTNVTIAQGTIVMTGGTGLTLLSGQAASFTKFSETAWTQVGGITGGTTWVRVSSQFDKTTDTTLANVPGLSAPVQAGRTYSFRAVLFVAANATGGHKYSISGTAVASPVIFNVETRDNTSKLYTLSEEQNALASAAGEASGTTYKTVIDGTLTVTGAGNLTVQFAQNAATGTSSVKVGSYLLVQDVP